MPTALLQAHTAGENFEPAPKSERPLAPVIGIDDGEHRAKVLERRDELIEEHTAMVRPIAQHLKLSLPPSFELDDLIQAGMIGLLHAATNYRPDQHGGAPFSAYARKRIRGEMLDSVSGRNWREGTMDTLEPLKSSGGRFGGEFTYEQQEPNTYGRLNRSQRGQLRAAGTRATPPDIDETIDQRRKLSQVDNAIAYLDVRSQRVLNGYYREEKTLEAVGAAIGYSRQTTGEVRDEGLAKVRRILHVVE